MKIVINALTMLVITIAAHTAQAKSSGSKIYDDLCKQRNPAAPAAEKCMDEVNQFTAQHPRLSPASIALRICANKIMVAPGQIDTAPATERNERACLYKAKGQIEQFTSSAKHMALAQKINTQLKSCKDESMDNSSDSVCIKWAFQMSVIRSKSVITTSRPMFHRDLARAR